LEVVLCVMRGGPAAEISDRQLQAEISAMPFVHPRLQATTVSAMLLPQPHGRPAITHEERLRLLSADPEFGDAADTAGPGGNGSGTAH
jgi:hypothetical protein